jgi:hypothetical protein
MYLNYVAPVGYTKGPDVTQLARSIDFNDPPHGTIEWLHAVVAAHPEIIFFYTVDSTDI